MQLISEAGHVHLALIELAQVIGLTIVSNINPRAMNDLLQREWKELDRAREGTLSQPPNELQIDLLRELGYINRVVPPVWIHHADGVLVLGGKLLDKVIPRLRATLNAYDHGWSFTKIHLLGCERELDPVLENIEQLNGPYDGLAMRPQWKSEVMVPFPKTEADMMNWVVSQLKFPNVWRYHTVRAPNVRNSDGTIRHANTEETVTLWKQQTGITGGRFFVVSNQPSIGYQYNTVKRVLGQNFELYELGEAALPSKPLGVFLACLARDFYEQYLIFKRLNS
jgi:hypothetical protein